jgi:serine/threonine protein kinase
MKDNKSSNNECSSLFNNKYEQVRLLGEGTFGKAFLVECVEDKVIHIFINIFKSLAVIKSIDLGNMSEEEKQEAFLEGQILEKLDHPNIIKFKEVYIEKKSSSKHTLHIVMDYADGGDLQQRIRAQKGKVFSENQIVDWFTQICLAVKHIHDRKIMHRDIKSQNIFLTKNGLAKLGDFGIAKCLSQTIDKAKTIVGTPYYLSPEIINGAPYNCKSDIWSLGVLLYEMCALKMPFDAQSLPLLSLKILRCSYNPLPPNFSKDLRSLMSVMLSVNINKRPSINEILRQPIIKSRIKNFLNEMEFNKEFSHTVLHKFNIFKQPKMEFVDLTGNSKEVNNVIKESNIGTKFDSNSSQEGKEKINNYVNENKKELNGNNNNGNGNIPAKDLVNNNNYQKPIIKKEEKVITNISNNNAAKLNNNNKKNYHYKDEKGDNNNNNNKDKDKDKDKDMVENILNLKRNLLSNNQCAPQGVANPEKKPQHALIINPNFGVNYVDKQKVKNSIEIETSRTPKVEGSKNIVELKKEKRHSEKKIEPVTNITSNNSNENFSKRNNAKVCLKKEPSIGVKETAPSSKKSSDKNISTGIESSSNHVVNVNLSGNINIPQERKRSDSKGSHQEDKNSIKDYIKNMKHKVRKNSYKNISLTLA